MRSGARDADRAKIENNGVVSEGATRWSAGRRICDVCRCDLFLAVSLRHRKGVHRNMLTVKETQAAESINLLYLCTFYIPFPSLHNPPTMTASKHTPLLPVDRQWLRKLANRGNSPRKEEDEPNDDGPIFILAPMVDQSDLPFRLLCRRYQTAIAVTPMIHARLLLESASYRRAFLPRDSLPQDRPLIAQICGGDPQTVLQAAQLLAPLVDGIDINCGCPQGIAKRGNYGAFLLEQPETLLTLVKTLTSHLPIPVSVKVRLLPGNNRDDCLQKSLHLYKQLVEAGIHMLTIHGRTRHNKGHFTGPSDWDAIRTIVQELGEDIPIVSNGSIASRDDALQCLEFTNCDAVMSSEAILEYPALFATNNNNSEIRISRVQLAKEYLEYCREYPPNVQGQGSGIKCIRMHLHRMLHADLQVHANIRDAICVGKTVEELEETVQALQQLNDDIGHDASTEELSWYVRHRQPLQDYTNNSNSNTEQDGAEDNHGRQKVFYQHDRESKVKTMELAEDAGECFACLFNNNEDDDEY